MFELHDEVRIIIGGRDVYVVTGVDPSRDLYRLRLLGINVGSEILKYGRELGLVAKAQAHGEGISLVPTSCEQLW